MSSHIQIFDTTLRDGEQTPGVNFTFDERLRIALQLEKWGVDVIEAGFPASSTGSFKSVQAIAQTLTTTAVCGLARCKKSDIDAVYEATKDAAKPVVHVFIATSPIHLEHKLKMSQEDVLASIKEHVTYAKQLFDVVQFSPEDATRTELPFLVKCVQTAVDAGATVINIPDTVGYSYHDEYAHIFKTLTESVTSSNEIIYSAHCHDDLGMAVSNSLAAIEGGARRIEGTVNGIGERAGNAALEEVALALYVRNDHYGAQTALNLEETKKTSDLISRYAGIRVPRNKAIVGQNAFSHESGIHQDGVLKLKALGYGIDKEAQIDLFKQFKAIADKKKSVSDRDIHAIIQGSEHEHQALYKLETLQLQYVSSGLQSAVVVVKDKEGHIYQDSSIGTGSIVAIYNAVDRIFQKETELIDYRINSVTEGTDAQAEVHVNLLIEGKTVNGFGIDHDILQASCKAYVEAHAKFAAENVEKVGN